MLKDRVEEVKKKAPALMKQESIACKYCGQMKICDVPEEFTEEELDELAVEMCDCFEAEEETSKKAKKERALKAISEQFGEVSAYPQKEAVLETLERVIDNIIALDLSKVSLDLGNDVKCKISTTAKGYIKVERIVTQKKSEEV